MYKFRNPISNRIIKTNLDLKIAYGNIRSFSASIYFFWKDSKQSLHLICIFSEFLFIN